MDTDNKNMDGNEPQFQKINSKNFDKEDLEDLIPSLEDMEGVKRMGKKESSIEYKKDETEFDHDTNVTPKEPEDQNDDGGEKDGKIVS